MALWASLRLLVQKLQKRREIPLRRGDRSQVLPNGQPRESVVSFCLHE
jgi:hypothetical protein